MTDRDIALEALRIATITYQTTMMNLGVNSAILEINQQILRGHEKTQQIFSEMLEILKQQEE